mmetsp:Transcript_4741/g.21208  ORF Transcript_4741/g.21208 Transcript_4741/m.21208 type:complete len:215 (+) Transcript_4741:336-980(+)
MCQAMDQNKNKDMAANREDQKTFRQKIFRLSACSVSGPGSKPPRSATRSRYACTISADHASPMYMVCEALKQLKGSRSGSGSSSGKKTLTAPTVGELTLLSPSCIIVSTGLGSGIMDTDTDVEPPISNRFRSCSFSARSASFSARSSAGSHSRRRRVWPLPPAGSSTMELSLSSPSTSPAASGSSVRRIVSLSSCWIVSSAEVPSFVGVALPSS